ncbi:hypothetical protein AG0111_0g10125 [Alternaria gaisen]|uniref:Uncharacterized protein n=1 Tax=Alternaria gaisen TaxID=167740 RepID=A0ACB6FAH4_9PLEO|nr:hypothetical protein AG0111_0g10125 [Alternaria gaisen]
MEDPEFSSSDGDRRYSQHSTSFDSAEWRSNSMSEFTGFNADWLESCSSYVHVEHGDADITGGSSRAVESWCSAEQPELQAVLADHNLQQPSPSYPNRQNSLHANQFDYMHLSTLGYGPQSGVDPQSNTDDQKEYWAQRSEPDYFAHPPPIPTPDAEYRNDFHLLCSVSDVLNGQGQALPNSGMPYYTQPVYPEEDLRGDIGPHYAGHTQESNNGACSHQHLVAEDVNGPWSTVNPQNNCPRHLEQHMNRILDVINASDSSASTWDASNEQQWGEASDVTVRPDNAQQSHQSGYSNASRHPLPTQHQAGLLMSRDLAIIPNGPRSLPIRTRSPSMRYVSLVSDLRY